MNDAPGVADLIAARDIADPRRCQRGGSAELLKRRFDLRRNARIIVAPDG
jgi:hypothetical protein